MADTNGKSLACKSKSKIDPKLAARLYNEGATLKDSLTQAGMAPTQANKGRFVIDKHRGLRKAFGDLKKRARRQLQILGVSLSPKEIENLVKGSLIDVAVTGEDGRGRGQVNASVALGKLRELQMFTPDSSVSVFNLQVPEEWADRYSNPAPPMLDAAPVFENELLPAATSSNPGEDDFTAVGRLPDKTEKVRSLPPDRQLTEKECATLVKRNQTTDAHISKLIEDGKKLDRAKLERKLAASLDEKFLPEDNSKKAGGL